MRVLIASDLSDASDEALRQGLSFDSGENVAVCHVTALLGTHTFLPQDYVIDVQQQLALQPRLADALRAQVARIKPGAEPHIFIDVGRDYAQIVERAAEWQAELLVVGSHGHTGLKHWLLGSVAERVVRHAKCPVLVARRSSEGAVLAATDLSDPSLPAIEAGAREAERRGKKLVVVHAVQTREGDAAMGLLGALPALDPPDVREARRALASQIINSALLRFGAKAEVVVADEDALTEVTRLAESLPAELVVVGTKGRTGLSRVALGSVAAGVVEHTHCSVLVVRQHPLNG
ncbi:MAG TPA: universal stress protein [Polyangiaceae bacterium]